jgi:iron complex transport system substrate-binding protein
MTGCAQNKGETVEKTVSFKITDGMGNELTFEKPAEKIIVFAPNALEIIDGLGAMDKVIGVDSWSVDNKEPLAKGFEGFGDFQSLNMEKITSANPDLIIGLVGWSEQDIKKVQDLGIKVYIVNATNIDGIYNEILNMGILIGKDKEAAKLKDDLENQVNEIVSRTSGLTQEKKPRVFYEVWNDPLMSAGTDTSINDLIEKAGGINILTKDGMTGWPEYSIEKLIQNDPEVIIAPVSLAPDASIILGDARLSTISAVKNKRVYIVPDNPVLRPSQNIIKGLTMFAKAIHPEIFGNFEVLQ